MTFLNGELVFNHEVIIDFLIVFQYIHTLLGSIPFGLIITKVFLNKDIRENRFWKHWHNQCFKNRNKNL